MNLIENIRDFLMGTLIFLVIGLTGYLLWGVVAAAPPGHAVELLLTLPFHLRASRLIVFFFLWGFYWLAFWKNLASFMRDPAGPIKIYRMSLVGILTVSAWTAFSAKFPSSSPAALLRNPGVTALVRLVEGMMGAIFPFIGVGAWFGAIGRSLGWGLADPLARELAERVDWKKRVNHDPFFVTAQKRGETYAGFEVTCKKAVFLNADERSKHTHVLGSTGSGKTRYVLFPMMRQDIQQGRGLVFVDAKGSAENAKVVYDMVRRAGREKDFLFFSLSHPEKSHTYNPLQHGNPSQLKDKITAAIDWSEPFYQSVCEHVLQALFMDLEGVGRRVTLRELEECLKDPPPLKNFNLLARRNKENIETLFNSVGLLVNTPFGHLLDAPNPEIDLMDVYRNQKIVYFALDTQSYQQTAMRLGKMITQDLNTLSGLVESGLPRSEKRPLAVYIDEYQAFGTKGFINALSRGRESGLWITIAHQSLGDLKAIDPAYSQQVLENTNTKIYLRVNDPETAQLFSDTVGTAKTIETTRPIHLGGEDPRNLMGSQRVVQEYLIHPNELKSLETGHAVFKSGQRYGRLILPGYFPDVQAIELPLREPRATSLRAGTPPGVPKPLRPIETEIPF